jgi:hypothetical protein
MNAGDIDIVLYNNHRTNARSYMSVYVQTTTADRKCLQIIIVSKRNSWVGYTDKNDYGIVLHFT